jgi:O-methyltransferase
MTLDETQDLYLDLLKGVLTRTICPDRLRPFSPSGLRSKSFLAWLAFTGIQPVLASLGLTVCRLRWDDQVRADGRDWPSEAETMVGMRRLQNIEYCVRDVLRREVQGDLIETGVWRGGVCILMRAILKVMGDQSRSVWVADSFQGLPKPDGRFKQDADSKWHDFRDSLGISLPEVRANFERYGLLDDRVRFLEGWFKDTLPTAPIDKLAVIRLDGDMYASTMDALNSLYPKLSVGGYVIVDDYGALESCSQAVTDFRAQNGIDDEIEKVDWSGVYWKKRSAVRNVLHASVC